MKIIRKYLKEDGTIAGCMGQFGHPIGFNNCNSCQDRDLCIRSSRKDE